METFLAEVMTPSEERASPDRVWEVYVALNDADSQPSSSTASGKSLMSQLTGSQHRRVLHAIMPADQSDAGKGSDTEMNKFIERAAFIFAQMRQLNFDSSIVNTYFDKSFAADPIAVVPSTDDYNFVLSRAAKQGRINVLTTVWQDMQSRSSTATPDRKTFEHLIQGLFQYAQNRVVQSYAHGSTSAWKKPSRSPEATQVATVSAQRCVQLLQALQAQGVSPTTKTLDMAARIFRLAGNLPALIRLLKDFFGVDLKHPDSEPSTTGKHRKLNTHTLNTIVMALGELATVPEMIVAYETLARPLALYRVSSPVEVTQHAWDEEDEGPVRGAKAEMPPGNLFSLDWSALSRQDAEAMELSASAIAPGVYHSPYHVAPDANTFGIMVKHALTPADTEWILSSPTASSRKRQSFASFANHVSEEQKNRACGRYVLFAQSLLNELLDEVRSTEGQPHAVPGAETLRPVISFASHKKMRGLLVWLEKWTLEAVDVLDQHPSSSPWLQTRRDELRFTLDQRIRPRLASLAQKRNRGEAHRKTKRADAEKRAELHALVVQQRRVERQKEKDTHAADFAIAAST